MPLFAPVTRAIAPSNEFALVIFVSVPQSHGVRPGAPIPGDMMGSAYETVFAPYFAHRNPRGSLPRIRRSLRPIGARENCLRGIGRLERRPDGCLARSVHERSHPRYPGDADSLGTGAIQEIRRQKIGRAHV